MTTVPETHRAYLLLGSNIDPQRNLSAAVRLLREHGKVVRTSQVWQSPPADGSSQADYLNAAVLLETLSTAAELRLRVLPEIEAALGRVRDPRDRYAARTIDIDIALFDDVVLDIAGARIPDPDILRRAFVAVPLAEIAPDDTHPVTGQTLRQIAAAFAGDSSLRVCSEFSLDPR